MKFIDSHCHLYSDQFDADRKEVLANAKVQGVSKIVLPNIDTESVAGMMDLVKENPKVCFPMMGLHPCSVAKNVQEQLEVIKSHLVNPEINFVGIGEIGIDLYWDKTLLEEQKFAFKEQCKWADERNLAIAIHVRDSFTEVFECLDDLNLPQLAGVFHCFTGNDAQAKKALSYPNFMLGIGGVVTFKNSKLGETLKNIVPVNRLMVETDSPYLSPHPKRGTRNTPENIPLVAEKLSEIYNLSLDEVASITSQNCETLFPAIA